MSASPPPLPHRPFLYFDVGGTLIEPVRPIPETYAAAFNAHGADVSPNTLLPIFRRVWRELAHDVPPGEDRYSRQRGGERGFWREFVRRVAEAAGLGIDTDPPFEELFEYFRRPEAWHLYDDVFETLDVLRADGVAMGVISNWDRRLPRLLDELGLTAYFDPILVSASEGVEKPDPRIFHRGAERAGVSTSECVYIGDTVAFDVNGARAAGMHPVLIARDRPSAVVDFPRSPSATDEAPAVAIDALSELPALLDGRPAARE